MAYRPATPSVPLSAYPPKGSIFHIDADGSAWDLLAYSGKKKEVFSINNADRGYQVIADVETGNQSVRSWSAAGGWTSVVALGGASGSFLDKVTTSPQSVASAVTWAELQTMSKGLDITGAMAGGEAMRLPDNTWIRPQTAGQALYLTNGSTPGTTNSTIHLTSGGLLLGAGDGTGVHSQIQLSDGFAQIYSQSNGSILDNLFLGNNNTSLTTDSGRGLYLTSNSAQLVGTGSILLAVGGASYDNAAGHIFSGGPITPTLGAGPATSLLGRNAANEIVSAGTAPSGGFMGLSGHNDLGTTPWSFGNDTTWASSFVGYQVDPSGTYQAWIKGNLLIDQGVSNALTLYRQDFNVGSTTCVYYDAQDSLGAQARYAEHCAQIAANTAGSVQGEWYVKTAVAGVMTERIRATTTGGLLTGAWAANGSIRGGTPNVGSITGWTPTVWATANTHSAVAAYANDGTVNLRCLFGAETTGKVVFDYDFSSGDVGYSWRRLGVELMSLSKLGKLALLPSTASSAMLNIGAFGVTVTSPVDGDIWKSASDVLSIRMSTNTRTIPFLQSAQVWAGIQTFNAAIIANATAASTTAGAIYRRTNYGIVGYESGMAQEFLAGVYTAPVGTALTNSTTATDLNGGTALFGTRTISATAMQVGTKVVLKARVKITNTAANTLTMRARWSSISGTILGTLTFARVNAGAEIFDLECVGIASAAPSAASATSWRISVEGPSVLERDTNVTWAGSEQTLATNAATAIVLEGTWSAALATSSVQVLSSSIDLI